MLYDVLIVGGGAAGLCAAIRIKQKNSKLSVAIAEKLSRVGKKLITTGNGRCNITNRNISIDRYHGENKEFASYALEKYSVDFTESFFADLGVVFTLEDDGKAYPYSLQASSVVDALRFGAERFGVEIINDCTVTDYGFKNGVYNVSAGENTFKCRNLIIAGGLLSGGEKLGCDGSLLRLMKAKGYSAVKTTPAIVQLKTAPDLVRSLKGMKVNAKVQLLCNGRLLREDSGEVLFCDYGLSGPPIMQLSRETARGNGKYVICLDIMPEYSFNSLCDMISTRKKLLSDMNIEEFFTGMLNKRVGQAILKQCGYKLTDSVKVIDAEGIKKAVSLIKKWQFEITGNTGFINSQVTAGGLSTNSFDSKTMMSKKEKGLFAIGEILDIDGDCGGFNLQWCWSSAFCAAEEIAK